MTTDAGEGGTPTPRDGSAPEASIDGTVPDAARAEAGTPEAGPPNDGSVADAPADTSADAGSPDGSPPDASTTTPAMPPLVYSEPSSGATVPSTVWVRLDFEAAPDPRAVQTVALDCGAGTPSYDVDPFEQTTLVVNPRAPLPGGASCAVTWEGPNGTARVDFSVATPGAPAVVYYDRNDLTRLDPFPDDFYLVDDGATTTGLRVDVRVPETDPTLQGLFGALTTAISANDGMSPLAPVVVSLPDAIDVGTVPRTARESVDPFATLGLFDIAPGSPLRGQRIPFDALVRSEANASGSTAHTLIAFPSVPLTPQGRYAFVVTNRALVDPSRPLEASAFFRTVVEGRASTPDELRLGATLDGVLLALEGTSPPLRADDLALALGFTVRSVDDFPNDLLAVRAAVRAAPPPAFTISTVTPDTTPGSSVAAVVTGTWSPLDFRNGDFIARDLAGSPMSVGTQALNFVLALPNAAVGSAVPIVLYQHGQPGSAEAEVPRAARRGLAAAGFAVVGFTDMANRDIIPTGDLPQLFVEAIAALLTAGDLPDYLSLLTHADQLSLLRMIPTFGGLDVLPLGAPDGQPDLDPSAPLGYLGISQGSVHGVGLLAFAPEIHAAALTAGGGRFGATLVHQAAEPLYQGLAGLVPTITRTELYGGMALVQMVFDRQDPLNLARHVHREPLDPGAETLASILLTEGLGDSLVPFYATRAAASALDIPQLLPAAEEVPFLGAIASPVQGNLATGTTGAFFQYVPDGYVGATPSPGCVANGEPEGHYCAQTAAEAIQQRVEFFQSALAGAPRIVAPTP